MSSTTNVRSEDLNYDHYENDKYDEDIKRVIPGYEDLHRTIEQSLTEFTATHAITKVLDLGIGTGITAERIMKLVPDAELTAVDFSDAMLQGAKRRLQNYKVQWITGDYAEVDFGKDFDVVISVIGMHHQTHEGKQAMFKKIFNALKPGGVFLFGDLMTHKDEKKAALSDAKHYHSLVEQAIDETTLTEWAHHHKFLNLLAPVEDQIQWLKEVGFTSVENKFEFLNTVFLKAER